VGLHLAFESDVNNGQPPKHPRSIQMSRILRLCAGVIKLQKYFSFDPSSQPQVLEFNSSCISSVQVCVSSTIAHSLSAVAISCRSFRTMASLARLQILICVVVGFVLPTYAGIIFAPVLNTCGSGGGTVLQDVVSMAKAAGAYMDNAPGNQKGDAKGHWDFYRVATLFDVIFGAQDGNSQGRWNEVRSNIQTIANLENTQPNAYVLCVTQAASQRVDADE